MVCERTPRYHQRAPSRPLLVGEPVISIPCFINGCHWTALTHRKVDDQVVFLYSDDLGDPHTEAMEKHHLSLCDERFYPPPLRLIGFIAKLLPFIYTQMNVGSALF